MTMPMDPFSPAETPANPQSAAAEWTSALNDPKVRSTLLSAGLQLMQPMQFGQTPAGHLAQAIGAAGETLTRQDELERQDQEQARKERDTDSQIESRADRSEVARANAETAAERARSYGVVNEATAALRRSQSELAVAKIGQINTQIQLLEMRVQMFPQDQQAKIDLQRARAQQAEAQAAYTAARTAEVPALTQSTIDRNTSTTNKNNTQADLNRTRTDLAPRNTEIKERQVSATERRTGAQETIARQRQDAQNSRTYSNEKIQHDKLQEMKPRAQRTPFPSYQDWLRSRSTSGNTTEPPDSELPSAPRDPAQRELNKRYMTPQGALRWTAEGWVK